MQTPSEQTPISKAHKPNWSDRLQTAGAPVVVGAGLLTLLVIACMAIGVVHDDAQSVAAIATASFGVIGSVVGAYFGVKVGAEGTNKALDAHTAEAARAQAFAAHLPEERARRALIDADKMARGVPLDEPDDLPGPAPEAG